ncbi:MAG TPA: SCO1664 family protein [Aggregatilineales bacterium]|nr:SCO1664 family protein [Aggregatilineales bacterium]
MTDELGRGAFSEPHEPFDQEEILRLLNCGSMHEEHGMLRWSSNYTFLVTIADGDDQMLAVYKPQRGERPLWDFPDGTLCCRETAAYVVSDALGWQIVPPTVLRDGTRGLGSVQFYVQNNPEVNYFSLDETFGEQLMRFAAFDYVINNADRKGGHVLLAPGGHLWGIDHGIGFHAAPKLRTVIWDFAGKSIPDPFLADIERLYGLVEDSRSRFRLELDRLLADSEVSALMARIRRVLQRREFPRPGPGPNYPWPPV